MRRCIEVLPDTDVAYDSARPLRIVALLHIFYPEMTGEMLDLADNLPGRYDLVITTPDAGRAAEINGIVARVARGDETCACSPPTTAETRVPS